MASRNHPVVALILLLLLITAGVLLGSNRHRQRQHQSVEPGAFDFYVLALSWSPEFCHSHPEKAECVSGRFGFVVHGLWPQYEDGYPENCSTAAGLRDPSQMTDIMPDESLVAHEWKTHGTCSGLDTDAYFKLVRRAFESVKIPPELSNPRQMFSITPRELKENFLGANPRLKAEDLTISCGNNYLTGVSVCFDKQLQPRACEGVRDCRANVIRVPPVQHGRE
jgi:ribonuclease T2